VQKNLPLLWLFAALAFLLALSAFFSMAETDDGDQPLRLRALERTAAAARALAPTCCATPTSCCRCCSRATP